MKKPKKPVRAEEARPAPPEASEPEEHRGLCHRCEHRVRFLEDGRHRPRCECGDIGGSKGACYMYEPVRPILLARLHDHRTDPRPMLGPPMFSSRSVRVGLLEHAVMRVFCPDLRKEQYVKYWAPKYRYWWDREPKNLREILDAADRDVVSDMPQCVRCGRNHRSLVFRPLARKAGGYTHWGTCPHTGEPLLLGAAAKKEKSCRRKARRYG